MSQQWSTGSVTERRVAEMIGLIGTATAAFAVTEINQAQIKALGTTPIQLVAASPGRLIWPLSGRLFSTYGTRAYTVPGVASIYPGDSAVYGNTVNSLATFSLQSLTQTVNSNEGMVLKTTPTPTDLSMGKSLVLYGDGVSPSNGNGSMIVYLVYRVI